MRRSVFLVGVALIGMLWSGILTSSAAGEHSAIDCNFPLLSRIPPVAPADRLLNHPIPAAVVYVVAGSQSCEGGDVQVTVFRGLRSVEGPFSVSSAYTSAGSVGSPIEGRLAAGFFRGTSHFGDYRTPASAPPPPVPEGIYGFAVRLEPNERIVFEARRGTQVIRREVRVSRTASPPMIHEYVRWLSRFVDAKAAAKGDQGPLMIQRFNLDGTGWRTLKPQTLPAACHLALCRMGTKENLKDRMKGTEVAYFTEP